VGKYNVEDRSFNEPSLYWLKEFISLNNDLLSSKELQEVAQIVNDDSLSPRSKQDDIMSALGEINLPVVRV